MKKKTKKLILVGLIFMMFLAAANFIIFSDDACGCSDSYMGATFDKSFCIYVGGELVFRRCVYVY